MISAASFLASFVFLLPLQESSPARDELRACRPQLLEIAAIDPDQRARARKEIALRLKPHRDALQKISGGEDGALAAIALGVMGDRSATADLKKLLDSGDAAVRRSAVEAYGLLEPGSNAKTLFRLFDSEDMQLALAAARAASNAKSGGVRRDVEKRISKLMKAGRSAAEDRRLQVLARAASPGPDDPGYGLSHRD